VAGSPPFKELRQGFGRTRRSTQMGQTIPFRNREDQRSSWKPVASATARLPAGGVAAKSSEQVGNRKSVSAETAPSAAVETCDTIKQPLSGVGRGISPRFSGQAAGDVLAGPTRLGPRAFSSGGQSARLITVRSVVRIHKGPPRGQAGHQRLTRGCSSVGRAPVLQAGGQRFESAHLQRDCTLIT
jgi:hypothetical protein